MSKNIYYHLQFLSLNAILNLNLISFQKQKATKECTVSKKKLRYRILGIKISDRTHVICIWENVKISGTSSFSVASSLNVFIVAPLFGNLETDRFCDNYSLLLEFIQSIHLLHWKNAADMCIVVMSRIRYILFIRVQGIISLLKAYIPNGVQSFVTTCIFVISNIFNKILFLIVYKQTFIVAQFEFGCVEK